MLAVQTESQNLFVPDLEIASLTPVYPDRIRVVLADGRVAYRPGPMPAGPWVSLHQSRVNPKHLTRQGDFWEDPAGYRYPYLPLEEIEEEEPDLPGDILTFEAHRGKYFWRTDSGLRECELKPDQAQQLYPQLAKLGRSYLVNLLRVRSWGHRVGGGWLECDNGERLEFSLRMNHEVCQALGVDGLSCIDRNHPATYRTLRDFPYDLTTADPDRIKRDCPTPQAFTRALLWQTVLLNLSGQETGYGHNHFGFADHPLATAGERCGYQLTSTDLSRAISHLVHTEGVINLSQLGFRESDTSTRILGNEVLLVAPRKQADEVLPLVKELGLSLLLFRSDEDRLALEYLAGHWKEPIQLVFLGVKEVRRRTIERILELLEVDLAGPPIELDSLRQLKARLKKLPELFRGLKPEPFRRIALQLNRYQLYLADPEEIAAWSPTFFGRWRVVLADGQVLHHPGPVPAGPWVRWGEHWVRPQLIVEGKDPAGFELSDQPWPAAVEVEPVVVRQGGPALPCAPEDVLYLDTCWHLADGRQLPTGLPAEQAAAHHPGLIRLNRKTWVHHNRIRSTRDVSIQLDGGVELPIVPSRHTRQLKELLGGLGLNRLGPDHHSLQMLGIRDFPFEIASASAALLRHHFSSAHHLICNILYQSYAMHLQSGVFPYGNTFGAYFYRPLQAVLYRAGYLRGQHSDAGVRDRFYLLFTRTLHSLVYKHRLFTYRQFGFKDHFPEDRTVKTRQILLVEKGDQLELFARQLQQEFGLSLLILKGTPSLLATEYFVEELKKRGIERVEVFFYGDFDYVGWDIGPAFVKQLKFYGVGCTRMERLVLAECFTAEELRLHSVPLDMPTNTIASRVRLWLLESGGINGQPLGIHANWFGPYERVRARLAELLNRQTD